MMLHRFVFNSPLLRSGLPITTTMTTCIYSPLVARFYSSNNGKSSSSSNNNNKEEEQENQKRSIFSVEEPSDINSNSPLNDDAASKVDRQRLPPARSIKRFWKTVDVKPSLALPGHFTIHLDNKLIRTPKGLQLAVPSESLAHAIAVEWLSQGTYLLPYTMPLMILATTATDRSFMKPVIIQEILSYLPTDLTLCRTIDPPRLVARMEEQWGPSLEFARKRFNVKFEPTTELTGAKHDEKDVKTIENYLLSLSPWELAVFDSLVHNLKSVALAIAVEGEFITAEKACQLSRLEENIQIEGWGEVEGSHDVDLLSLQVNVSAASVFKRLLNTKIK